MNERTLTAGNGSPTARRTFGAALFDALYESRLRHASLEIQKHRHLLDSPRGRRICAAAGRPLRLQWEYRRSLNELASLADDHLRDLRFGASNFPDIAWSEAHRCVDATTAQSVAVGIAVMACAVTAAGSLMLVGF